MPIYEFICDHCQQEFEELVFGDAIPLCPYCESEHCQKLISRPCVHHGGVDGGGYEGAVPTSGGSKCSGCSGKSCATCH